MGLESYGSERRHNIQVLATQWCVVFVLFLEGCRLERQPTMYNENSAPFPMGLCFVS